MGIIDKSKEIQRMAAQFLYENGDMPYTYVEEWTQTQSFLTQSIGKLIKQEGRTPDEEGEVILAILMGYTIVIRNSKNIDIALERAERVFPLIKDPLLKCKLAIFCYGECFDEELANTAHQLIKELKKTRRGEELASLEILLQSMEEMRVE